MWLRMDTLDGASKQTKWFYVASEKYDKMNVYKIKCTVTELICYWWNTNVYNNIWKLQEKGQNCLPEDVLRNCSIQQDIVQ